MPLVVLLEVVGAFLARLIASRIGQWILTAILFFGINFVSKKVVVENVIPQLQAHMAGLGALTLAWMAYLNIDRGISVILSAYAAGAGTRFVMQRASK
ncbi:DUF2523 family protein [Luteibacter sp.]|uniref:DUF2523 family protein n=1 Tax=Luteibacter sp. TaxID=1886636 RepID=UPI003F7E31CC